jgi:putative intracellular protease/amidase
MRFKALVLAFLILLFMVSANPAFTPTAQGKDVGEVKALILIADFFGWNYFDAKDILESWGVNVTTITNSLNKDVPSCLNKPPRGTTANLLLSDVEDDIIEQFDILLIPAGGQWRSLYQSPRVREFIADAHEHDIVIASICIGNTVLAYANNIVNGSNVVSYSMSNPQMTNAGATIRTQYRTVIDNNIVTGGTGGGPTGGGYEIAPTEEVCIAALRAALGYSFMGYTSISPQTGTLGTNFTITVEVTDLDDQPVPISSGNQNISAVNAKIYSDSNGNLANVVELTDDNGDGVYSGLYTANASGLHVIDIEVEDTNGTLEVKRDAMNLSVESGFTIDTATLAIIATGSLAVIVVIVILQRRQNLKSAL